MHVQRIIEIDAPIAVVWRKISNLTDIQNWSQTINQAHYHTDVERGLGAGRTCDVKGFGTIVKNVLEWNENESFKLSMEGAARSGQRRPWWMAAREARGQTVRAPP
jgi:hypothetical protein